MRFPWARSEVRGEITVVRGSGSRWGTARHAATGSWPVVLLGNRACPLANTASICHHPTYAIGVTPAFPPLRKRCQPDPHPPFLAPLAVGKHLSCLVAHFCWSYFRLDLLPTNKTPRRAQHCRRAVAGPRTEVRGPWNVAPVRCGRCRPRAVVRRRWSVDRGPGPV